MDENTYSYIVEGDPVPWARVSVGRRPKIHLFDPQADLKRWLAITLKNQHTQNGKKGAFTGPLQVDFFFYFHIPKTRKDLHDGDYKVSVPDSDNLLKLISDVGQLAGLWSNDSTIVAGQWFKKYSDHPRTEFIVTELNNAKGTQTQKEILRK